MAKKKSNKFLWGVIFGIIISVAGYWYYNNYVKKTEFEKAAGKIEKEAKKAKKDIEEGAKKFFDNQKD